MENLLKFEFRKLFHQKSFYVILILMIAFCALSAVICYFAMVQSERLFGESIEELKSFSTCDIMILNSLSEGSFFLLFGLFAIIFLTGDFTEGTMKNIIARGFSREKTYYAKYIVILVASLIMAFTCYLITFISYFSFFGMGTGWSFKTFGLIGSQLLVVLAFASMACFVSMLMQRVGSSIFTLLGGEIVVSLTISIIDLIVGLGNPESTFSLYPYWLMNFQEQVSSISAKTSEILTVISGSIAYAGVFFLLGLLATRKRDIK